MTKLCNKHGDAQPYIVFLSAATNFDARITAAELTDTYQNEETEAEEIV